MARKLNATQRDFAAASAQRFNRLSRALKSIQDLDFPEIIDRAHLDGVVTAAQLRRANNLICTALRASVLFEYDYLQWLKGGPPR